MSFTIHLSKPIKCATPRVNPKTNCGLCDYVIVGSSMVTKEQKSPLVGMLVVGAAVHVWGQGVHGKSLYLPLNFVFNLKLL